MARPCSSLSTEDHERWIKIVRALLKHYHLEVRDITLDGNYRPMERAMGLSEKLSGPRARSLTYALLEKIAPLCDGQRDFRRAIDLCDFIWTDTDLRSRLKKRLPRAPLPPMPLLAYNLSDVAYILTQALVDAEAISAGGAQVRRIERALEEFLRDNESENARAFLEHYEDDTERLEAMGATVFRLRDYVKIVFFREPYLVVRKKDETDLIRDRIDAMPGKTRSEKLGQYLRETLDELNNPKPRCLCDICTGVIEDPL